MAYQQVVRSYLEQLSVNAYRGSPLQAKHSQESLHLDRAGVFNVLQILDKSNAFIAICGDIVLSQPIQVIQLFLYVSVHNHLFKCKVRHYPENGNNL